MQISNNITDKKILILKEENSKLRSEIDEIRLMFDKVNKDFKEELADEFGTFLLYNINQVKKQSVSHQRLPSSLFDEAAVISFLDSMCI